MAKHELIDSDMSDSHRQKLDTTRFVSIRTVLSNRQAAILIGESGETITKLKSFTGAEIDISEQLRGAIDRILTITGLVEDITTLYKAVIHQLLGEDIEQSNDSEAHEMSIKIAVPHLFLGAIIGSGGYRLQQIMEGSNTKIYASEFCLPLSSERSLTITGKASGISTAIAEIGKEYLTLKTKAENIVSNPYVPVSMSGRNGHPESFRNIKPHDTMLTPSNPYGVAPASFNAPAPDSIEGSNENIVLPNDPRAGAARGATKDKLIQQIYIPNDMVGAIIGKQGSKINEIRQLSGSHIKINEPEASRTNERLITVEGSQEQNQLALYMLYQRLESEKRRQ